MDEMRLPRLDQDSGAEAPWIHPLSIGPFRIFNEIPYNYGGKSVNDSDEGGAQKETLREAT
jgi:hypothetical protein